MCGPKIFFLQVMCVESQNRTRAARSIECQAKNRVTVLQHENENLRQLLQVKVGDMIALQRTNAQVCTYTIRLCICICVYVYTCIYICVCRYIRVDGDMYLYVCMYVYCNAQIRRYVHGYMYVYTYVYVYIQMRRCVHKYIYVYMYEYMYIYLYTYTCR